MTCLSHDCLVANVTQCTRISARTQYGGFNARICKSEVVIGATIIHIHFTGINSAVCCAILQTIRVKYSTKGECNATGIKGSANQMKSVRINARFNPYGGIARGVNDTFQSEQRGTFRTKQSPKEIENTYTGK